MRTCFPRASAGVGHHVVLSITGIDRVPFGYCCEKRRQERIGRIDVIRAPLKLRKLT